MEKLKHDIEEHKLEHKEEEKGDKQKKTKK